MLTHLFVKDYILIDYLDLDLRDGFTAITGETGAGKSILIGAIGLILGNRAESKSVKEGASKAVIEAEFDLKGVSGLKTLFEKNDLDYSETCIIRREITPRGGRAFINDTPVTSGLLKTIGGYLVDIHSQHHNMLIGEASFQLQVIDLLAENSRLLEEYESAYEQYIRAGRTLKKEIEEIRRHKEEEEFLRFRASKLESANLKKGELEVLTEKLSVARHAEEILEALHAVTTLGSDANDRGESVIEELSRTLKTLDRVRDHHSKSEELYERLDSIRIELQDLTGEAESLQEGIELDPEEKEILEGRLDELQSLLFLYKADNLDQLIELREELKERLDKLEYSDQHVESLRKQLKERETEARAVAERISTRRQMATEALYQPLHHLMSELGIAGASFSVEFTPTSRLTSTGIDEIRFLFATNKNGTLQPIKEIASGGEISRFMLALKTLLAQKATLPTVIFDEIDTGVSGEAAGKTGSVLLALSRHLQVLTITHLPQIAALADRQLLVYKEETEEGFHTRINELNSEEERTESIASMLSGTQVTNAALENARTLLQEGQKRKQKKGEI